jgi:hypothetical protein
MANLISPGVSVTITDESMYVPTQATTIPLFFIATSDHKTRADGITAAAGTYESNVIRTVTSLKQSVELFGVPRFLTDSSGNPLHGDARNEYGLFALNQYLGVGNMAYVIRANVNLNDTYVDLQTMWTNQIAQASYVLENLVANYINSYNQLHGYHIGDAGFKTTVIPTELQSLIATATYPIWTLSSFVNAHTTFIADHTASPLPVYANGFGAAATGTFLGVNGMILAATVPEWTALDAGNLLINAGDLFKSTNEFLNETSLGANDAARRVTIVTALRAIINGNTDILSDTYEYNLIACPGYYETAPDLLNLSVNIQEEAFVVADTPMNLSPEDVVTWRSSTGQNSAASSSLAYYYPHGYASNIDGHSVFCASSGIAIRTITYSDQVSQMWFAPAGLHRGLVTGVSDVGYVSGTLGTPTTFNSVALNNGQRDNLYKDGTNINPITYFPSKGIVIWGQKTAALYTSALDRINVVRMLMYVKRSLRRNTLSFVFEPNDKLTRDNLKAVVDSFLSTLIVTRGLYDFATVCDNSNNTPTTIDLNQLYIDVALKPVKAAEFIYIPIRVVATGTSLTA